MKIEKIEDEIIVERIKGSPERKVFRVDVGDMPVEKIIENLKRIMEEKE